MEIRVARHSILPSLPCEAQPVIARWRQADKVEVMRPYGKPFFDHFMHNDAVGGLLQAGCSKDILESVDQALYARRSVDMQVGGTGIASRPGASVQKRHQVRNMVWVKMRYHDMFYLVVLHTSLQQPLNYAMPAVEQDGQSVQLYKYARCPPLRFDLARAGTKKGDTAHLRDFSCLARIIVSDDIPYCLVNYAVGSRVTARVSLTLLYVACYHTLYKT